MFDIGFTELLLCLVIALVVIGPEQLPGTVRTVALWIGRLKRSLAETRSEIERQIGADEIRRQLHNEEILQRVEETRLQLEASLREHGFLEHNNNNTLPDNNSDHTPSAADYGPPDELPDHFHSDSTDTPPKAQNTNVESVGAKAQGSPASGSTPSSPAGSTPASPHSSATAAISVDRSDQQSQVPVGTAAATSVKDTSR